jgi:hypothetical protein
MVSNLLQMGFKHCLRVIEVGAKTTAQQGANGDLATWGLLQFLLSSLPNHLLFSSLNLSPFMSGLAQAPLHLS